MRLDKYLCDCGLGSRSDIKQLIKKKSVYVDDVLINDPGYQVTGENIIIVDGNIITYQKYHYFIMNKPAGVITAREDNISKTVMDLMNEKFKDLSPVGRLDKDTEGILLITDNGKLNHNMLSPKKHVNKKYLVHLEHEINIEDIKKIESGLDIKDDKPTLPALVDQIEPALIELTICEGRYHQVKRMMEAVDNRVIKLKRLSFGPLVLTSDLLPGTYRELNSEELNKLTVYM